MKPVYEPDGKPVFQATGGHEPVYHPGGKPIYDDSAGWKPVYAYDNLVPANAYLDDSGSAYLDDNGDPYLGE